VICHDFTDTYISKLLRIHEKIPQHSKDAVMNSSDLTIAIVGATGAVGRIALDLLEERNHPASKIVAMASIRSVGKFLPYADVELPVIEATPDSFDGVDVAFISASSEVSKQLAPEAVKRGALVIDDGSAYRMEAGVPLVVPEVNGEDVEWHSGIISIPNCTTTPLVMVLDALRSISPVTAVTVATYQAVTGTGASADVELLTQSRAILDSEDPVIEQYPHQIAFNALPQVDDFIPNGYTKEEEKMLNESRKILHDSRLPLASTCVRIPVRISHSEAVTVEFQNPVSPVEARAALSDAAGIQVVDDPQNSLYPMPLKTAGRDEVQVGRIREDIAHDNGLSLWLSCDNLRKGAALNALQILDEVLKRDCLKPTAQATRT
jgi:aspartate-semialdehyde dehydrogenase